MPADGIRVEFLTAAQCLDHARTVRLTESDLLERRRVRGLGRTEIFPYRSRLQNADDVAASLVLALGDFIWAVLWAYRFPFGDLTKGLAPPDDWKRYGAWRRGTGETRTPYEAPGHKFAASEPTQLAKAIRFAIHAGWDTAVFACPSLCLIRLSHDDFIEVHAHSRDTIEKLSTSLSKLDLSRGTLG